MDDMTNVVSLPVVLPHAVGVVGAPEVAHSVAGAPLARPGLPNPGFDDGVLGPEAGNLKGQDLGQFHRCRLGGGAGAAYAGSAGRSGRCAPLTADRAYAPWR